MRTFVLATSALIAAALVGCGGGGSTDTHDEGATPSAMGAIQSGIFDVHCTSSGCHGGSAPAADLDLEAGRAHDALVNRPSTQVQGKTLVVPGSPEESFLVDKIKGHLGDGEGEPMPYAGSKLSDADVAAIETWVREGAKP